MNKNTCIEECDTLGYSLKQIHIIIYIYKMYNINSDKLCIT